MADIRARSPSASFSSRRARQVRMSACRRDLLANGIDLGRAGPGSLRRLVRRHLDYFQLMLGYDATPAEVIALCRRSESNGRRQDARSGRV